MSSDDPSVPKGESADENSVELHRKLRRADDARRRWRLFAIFAIIVLVAGGGYWAYTKYWSEPAPTAPTPSVKMSDMQLAAPNGYLSPQIPAGTTIGEVEVYVQGSVYDARAMYEPYLVYSGITPNSPHIFSVSAVKRQTWESKCVAGVANDHATVFYCKADNIVWLPQLTLQKVWDPKELGLDAEKAKTYRPAFAAAAAGVYGYSMHLIEMLWTQPELPHWSRENDDLLATCFTGAWAGTERALTEADLSGALSAMMRFASPMSVRPRAEASAAFLLAYKTGRPLACLKEYWPGFAPKPSASPSGSPSDAPPSASPSAAK